MITTVSLVLELIVCLFLLVVAWRINDMIHKLIDRVANLAMKVRELEETIDEVDKSTGADIHRLAKDLEDFRADYGDAAIEEMKESAKAQKAWADGLNNIMSYGASLHGGGNKT